MRFLFKPAISLLDRLSYPLKFGLIVLVCAASATLLLSGLFLKLRHDVRLTEQEIAGLELVDAGVKVTLLVQQHRGLSAGILGGSAALAPDLKEKAAAAGAAAARIDALLAANADWQAVRPAWAEISARLGPLLAKGLDMGAAENFGAHTTVVEALLKWLRDVGDVSSLSLDPDAGSYNLIEPLLNGLPELTERLGRLRGRGTGLLARGSLTREDEHAIVAQLADLARTQAVVADRLERAAAANPYLADRLARATAEIETAVGRLRASTKDEILGQRFQIEPSAFFALGTAAIDTVVGHLNGTVRPDVLSLLEARKDRLEATLRWQLAVSLFSMLVAAYLFIAVYLSIVRSVRELSEGAQRIAGGDYCSRVTFSARDELAEVADRFNVMAEQVAQLIREIQQDAAEVGRSATELSGSARRVSQGSDDQTAAAAGVADAVEKMTAMVDDISRHAGTAQELAAASDRLSVEGAEVMRRSVTEMERIAEAVDHSGEAIRELGEKSREISTIIGSIREIADQTNLLALNAAIEAARAGESGRGFAVVADEVRKLAERTARATEEIAGMVHAIQNGTGRAVETMQRGVQRVRDGVELSNRAGESMAQISAGAQQVLSAVSDISSALREQSSTSNAIAHNVEGIAQMAEANNLAVRETASTASRLEDLATKLRKQVERFRV
ncbi:MAG: HAMP domain-containing protein [Thauera sp.]|nr:HAMP domain-containing protein [Thauera sp.]